MRFQRHYELHCEPYIDRGDWIDIYYPDDFCTPDNMSLQDWIDIYFVIIKHGAMSDIQVGEQIHIRREAGRWDAYGYNLPLNGFITVHRVQQGIAEGRAGQGAGGGVSGRGEPPKAASEGAEA